MSTIRYLCDENVPRALVDYLVQQEPAMEIVYVGQDEAPLKGTLDPLLLQGAEAGKWTLVSLDRSTMPGHVREHVQSGRHTYGVFLLRDGFSLKSYASDLLLIWSCSDVDDWRDRLEYIPWED
jgi:hypothetical protein